MIVHSDGKKFRVSWKHRREFLPVVEKIGIGDNTEFRVRTVLSARGGYTECTIELVGDGFGLIGRVKCSKDDNYCKAVGRRLSLEDALDGFGETLIREDFIRALERQTRC